MQSDTEELGVEDKVFPAEHIDMKVRIVRDRSISISSVWRDESVLSSGRV